MNIISKTLVPNKEWILKNNESKIGSISKSKKGFSFYKKGQKVSFKNIKEIQDHFGIALNNENAFNKENNQQSKYEIYNFPCSSKPFDAVYDLKKKLPLFSKSSKSKSRFCAGYYLVKFRKGWVKGFCPKLITLERYKYFGPYKTEQDLKLKLNNINKNETSQHDSN